MISLWMIYFVMILLGHWFGIDSPLYTSIYASFFGLVLLVTLITVFLKSIKTINDVWYLWIVFFAITLMNQFGVVIEMYSASPYFALYMTVMLLVIFVKTIISPLLEEQKTITFLVAFAAILLTRLTELIAGLWYRGVELANYPAELANSIAQSGGLSYFINPMQLIAQITRLTNLGAPSTWVLEDVADIFSGLLFEAALLALPIAAIAYGVMWWLEHQSMAQEEQEREFEEFERLENELKARENEEVKRREHAKSLIEQAAAGGAKAQYDLGMLFVANGDTSNAAQWLQKAADNGNTLSQYELGKMYYKGSEGLPQDLKKAHDLFKQAAIADHTEAQFLLGCMYFGAEVGDKPDYSEAALWFGKASGNGHVKSMGMLAQVHTMGDEFPEADAHLAIKLIKKLANDHNDPNEDISLNVLYYNGLNAQEEAKLELAWEKRSNGKKQRDTEIDDLTAELYWLNEGIKQKRKFLHDFADNWDWRNDETQKSLKEDILKSRELADKLDELMGRNAT